MLLHPLAVVAAICLAARGASGVTCDGLDQDYCSVESTCFYDAEENSEFV